jgi:hypothetical protein
LFEAFEACEEQPSREELLQCRSGLLREAASGPGLLDDGVALAIGKRVESQSNASSAAGKQNVLEMGKEDSATEKPYYAFFLRGCLRRAHDGTR